MYNSSIDRNKGIEIHITPLNIDKEAFGRLYDLYVKPIYRFVYLKVNSREEAEDLTSETFLKAWDYISKPENSQKIRNAKAFFYQVASNLVIDFYRKKAFLPVSLASLGENSEIKDEKELIGADKLIREAEIGELKRAFQNIPPNYSDTIIWYYLEDLKISEIAEVLKKSEGTVRVLIHRALKALKREMEKIEKEKKELVEGIEGRETSQISSNI